MLVDDTSEAKRTAKLGFQAVYEPVRPYLDALDAFLHDQLDELEPEIREHAAYVFGHSGKRLRPMLVAYSGWNHGDPARSTELVRLGAVIELVHLATLVHDDILDGAEIRHRQQTATARFGASHAVLVGDALFAHALHLAAQFPTTEVCRLVARATSRVCAGEIAQTFERGTLNDNLERYFRVIDLKTAELFRVSCLLGASTGGHSAKFADAAAGFGRHLGVAYQIFDDLADVIGTEGQIGKTLGTDLASGKFTLPTLLLLRYVDATERERLLHAAFHDPAHSGTIFTQAMAEYPVEAEVRRYFEAEMASAARLLEPHREKPAAGYLCGLAAFVAAQFTKL